MISLTALITPTFEEPASAKITSNSDFSSTAAPPAAAPPATITGAAADTPNFSSAAFTNSFSSKTFIFSIASKICSIFITTPPIIFVFLFFLTYFVQESYASCSVVSSCFFAIASNRYTKLDNGALKLPTNFAISSSLLGMFASSFILSTS